MAPLLTQVIIGRNDNYLGNFNQRLELVVNYTCAQAAAAGHLDDYELLIVDWNSLTPLHLELDLNEEARARTWFLEVPPEILAGLALDFRNPDQPVYDYHEAFKGWQGNPRPRAEKPEPLFFHPAAAANVGLRRARGKFIIYTPADVFFPRLSLTNLFSLLKTPSGLDLDRAYLGVDRFLVPWQRAERLDLAGLDRYLSLHSARMSLDLRHIGHTGGEGGLAFGRALIHQLRGIDESYVDWGFHDTELARRVAQTGLNLKAAMAGVFCYDFQQRPRQRSEGISRANLDQVRLNQQINDENWGLGQVEIPFLPAGPQPEVFNRPEGARPYDRASLLEINPARPSGPVEFWRRALKVIPKNLIPETSGGRLFKLAGKLRKRSVFSRLGFETLLGNLPYSFGPWFGDRRELFDYFRQALDKGLYRLISRWSPEQALTMLAVLATVGRRRPDRFFYAGMRDFYVAQAAAAVDPTLEISAYDHWSTKLYPAGHGGDRLYYYGHISTALNEVGFQGYLHIQTGPLETAFERLAATALAGEPFEVMFLNLDFLAPILDSLPPQISPLSTPDCALVLRGREDRLGKAAAGLQALDFQEAGRLPGLIILQRPSFGGDS